MNKVKLFNIGQANIFLKNGCEAVGVGFADSKIYIEIKVNDKLEEMMQRWRNKEFINTNIKEEINK